MIEDLLRTGIDRLRSVRTTVRKRIDRLACPHCGITGRIRAKGRTIIEQIGDDPDE